MSGSCQFTKGHERFYCRIHADVRLSLTDEQCRTAARLAAAPPVEPGSGGRTPTFSGENRADCEHCGFGLYAHECPVLEQGRPPDIGWDANDDYDTPPVEPRLRADTETALEGMPDSIASDYRAEVLAMRAVPPPVREAGLRAWWAKVHPHGSERDWERWDAEFAALLDEPVPLDGLQRAWPFLDDAARDAIDKALRAARLTDLKGATDAEV